MLNKKRFGHPNFPLFHESNVLEFDFCNLEYSALFLHISPACMLVSVHLNTSRLTLPFSLSDVMVVSPQYAVMSICLSSIHLRNFLATSLSFNLSFTGLSFIFKLCKIYHVCNVFALSRNVIKQFPTSSILLNALSVVDAIQFLVELTNSIWSEDQTNLFTHTSFSFYSFVWLLLNF